MTVQQLIAELRQLRVEILASNFIAAFTIMLKILAAFGEAVLVPIMTARAAATTRTMETSATEIDLEKLCDEIECACMAEECCDGDAMASAPKGSFISLLLPLLMPLLMELLKKLPWFRG